MQRSGTVLYRYLYSYQLATGTVVAIRTVPYCGQAVDSVPYLRSAFFPLTSCTGREGTPKGLIRPEGSRTCKGIEDFGLFTPTVPVLGCS